MADPRVAADCGTTVTLDAPVPGELADELSRRIYFASPEITGFELGWSGDAVTEISLRLARPADQARLHRKLNLIASTQVLAQYRPRPQVIWKSASSACPARAAYDELAARGIAQRTAAGLVSLAEPMLTLIDRLDELLQDMAVSAFGAIRMRYPTLIPTSALTCCGYLTSFPQNVMFATRLHADLDAYREFLAQVAAGEPAGEAAIRHGHPADLCLPPTMCYHTFHQLAGQVLQGPVIITSRGPSFRHEGRYEVNLERLWDFTIREVVFIGSPPEAAGCRQRLHDLATSLLDDLGLCGYSEVASDPFFGGEAAQASSAQLMLSLKYEARLFVAPERSIAVGSFNVHDRLFTGAFDIRLPGQAKTASACAGFGLERFAYAVVCQHGLDERRWPALLRTGASR